MTLGVSLSLQFAIHKGGGTIVLKKESYLYWFFQSIFTYLGLTIPPIHPIWTGKCASSWSCNLLPPSSPCSSPHIPHAIFKFWHWTHMDPVNGGAKAKVMFPDYLACSPTTSALSWLKILPSNVQEGQSPSPPGVRLLYKLRGTWYILITSLGTERR